MQAPMLMALFHGLAGLSLLWFGSGAGPASDVPRLGDAPRFPVILPEEQASPKPLAESLLQEPPAGPFKVFPQNRENSRAFYNTYYAGAATPAINWTGNRATCDAGTTAAAFRDAVALRINYFRAMAGIPAGISFDDTNNSKAQQAGLMMSVNNQLSHNPPTSWLCYTAAGAEAAGSSNLALGAYGWTAMTLYMQDPGTNNGPVGHRRWILYPQTQKMGTGDLPPTEAANALWVFDSHLNDPRPATRDEFVAWPPPGYVPYQVVFPRWSFSYPSADFSQATVTMTQNQQSVSLIKETVYNAYGENTVVWIPNGMSSWDPWPNPSVDTAYQVTIGNVLVSGTPRSFSYKVTVFDPAISTITTTQDLLDFGGDRKTDPTVFRSGSGMWYSLVSNPPPGYTETQWGLGTDIPVPADYDGDKKTDIAVWRPSNGVWYILPSSTPGGVVQQQWGVQGDMPLPADYDGDGKADLAVWRPSSGFWYVIPSGNPSAFTSTHWGVASDIPVPADYDGDLKTDIAVWRASTGFWFLLPSSTPAAFASIQWGLSGDVPLPADYDGDGEADIAIRRPSAETWYVLPSNSAPGTFTSTKWGLAADKPVPADYDGDGKADIAVWRPEGGVWYVLPSGTPGSYTGTPWGVSSDLPLSPAAHILRAMP